MSGRLVSYHKSVLALFVLEEIKHPLPFHQSGNKIEFGLAVLQRHVKSLIGALESVSEVTKSELPEISAWRFPVPSYSEKFDSPMSDSRTRATAPSQPDNR
jgi:hypothetical protein